MTKAAIIGGGVIGSGWAARFLLMGWDVSIYDPAPDAWEKAQDVIANARRSLPGLFEVKLPQEGQLVLAPTIEDAVRDADWIQESVPERLEIKHATFSAIQTTCPDTAIIGSSTSGFKPSELQSGAPRPAQIIVTHPFNPVYLLPLVELVTTPQNSASLIQKAKDVLAELAFYPLHVKKEIDAHIADRLLEAVWREALWLVKDKIATTQEIDDAICYGFGLRWAQMGLFETYRIAGGTAGMRHFLKQFGPALKWPWTKLMDVPELTEELVERIASQSEKHSKALSIRDLERIRDKNLVAILRALKAQEWGAGKPLNLWDHSKKQKISTKNNAASLSVTLEHAIPLDWVDYNGHMNEARYLQAFGDATTEFMNIIGCDEAYIRSGGSYFTAETHIRHLAEAHTGEIIRIETQCLSGAGKKIHLFHFMYIGEKLIATGEHMMIHVSLETRRASAPAPHIAEKLSAIATAHANLPLPAGAGKAIGVKG